MTEFEVGDVVLVEEPGVPPFRGRVGYGPDGHLSLRCDDGKTHVFVYPWPGRSFTKVPADRDAGAAAHIARRSVGTGQVSSRYVIGYYCPRGSGHLDLFSDPDYDGSCGSKGWEVVLYGAEPGDMRELPEGEWRDDE